MAEIKKTTRKDLQIFRGTYEECMAQPTVNMQFYLAWDTQQLFVGNANGGKTPYTGSSRAQIQKYLDTLRDNINASLQGKITTEVSKAVLTVADQIETILRADFEEELLDLKEGLTNAGKDLNALEGRIDSLGNSLSETKEELSNLSNEKDQLETEVDGIIEDVQEIVDETIPAINETLNNVIDTKITAVEGRLDAINGTLGEVGNARFENVKTEDVTTGDPEYYYNLEGDSSLGETFYKDQSGHVYTIDKEKSIDIVDTNINVEFTNFVDTNPGTFIRLNKFLRGFDPNNNWFASHYTGVNNNALIKITTDPASSTIAYDKRTFENGLISSIEGFDNGNINTGLNGEKNLLRLTGKLFLEDATISVIKRIETIQNEQPADAGQVISFDLYYPNGNGYLCSRDSKNDYVSPENGSTYYCFHCSDGNNYYLRDLYNPSKNPIFGTDVSITSIFCLYSENGQTKIGQAITYLWNHNSNYRVSNVVVRQQVPETTSYEKCIIKENLAENVYPDKKIKFNLIPFSDTKNKNYFTNPVTIKVETFKKNLYEFKNEMFSVETEEIDSSDLDTLKDALYNESNIDLKEYTFTVDELPWELEIDPRHIYTIETGMYSKETSYIDETTGETVTSVTEKHIPVHIQGWKIEGEHTETEKISYSWNGLVKKDDLADVAFTGEFDDLVNIPDFGDVIIKNESEDIYPKMSDENKKMLKNSNGLFECTLENPGVLWNFENLKGDPSKNYGSPGNLNKVLKPIADELYTSLYSMNRHSTNEKTVYSLTNVGGVKIGGSSSGSGLAISIYDNLKPTKVRIKVSPYYNIKDESISLDEAPVYVNLDGKELEIRHNIYYGVRYIDDMLIEMPNSVINKIANAANVKGAEVTEFVRNFEANVGINGDMYLALCERYPDFKKDMDIDNFLNITKAECTNLTGVTLELASTPSTGQVAASDRNYSVNFIWHNPTHGDIQFNEIQVSNISSFTIKFVGSNGEYVIYENNAIIEDLSGSTLEFIDGVDIQDSTLIHILYDYLGFNIYLKNIFNKRYYKEPKIWYLEADTLQDNSGHYYIEIMGSKRFILYGIEIFTAETGYRGLPMWQKVNNSSQEGGPSIIKVTWEELKGLRDNSELIPGQKYQITDYETSTGLEGTMSARHPFDIIVTASAINALSEDARATYHFKEQKEEVINCPNGGFKDGITLEDIHIVYSISSLDQESIYNSVDTDGVITKMSYLNGIPALYNPSPDGIPSDDVWLSYCGQYTVDGETYDGWLGEDVVQMNPQYIKLSNIVVDPNKKKDIIRTNATDIDDYFKSILVKAPRTLESIKEEFWNTGEQLPPLDEEKLAIRVYYSISSVDDYNTYWAPGVDIICGIDTVNLHLYKNGLDYYLRDEPADNILYSYAGDVTYNSIVYNKWNINNSSSYVLTNKVVNNNAFIITQSDIETGIKNALGVTETPEIIEVTRADIPSWKIKYCLDNDITRFNWASTIPVDVIQTYNENNYSLYIRSPEHDTTGLYAWAYKISADQPINISSIDYNENTSNNFVYTRSTTLKQGDDVLDQSSNIVNKIYSVQVRGTGVIYYMKDEFDNEAPYDFKNILIYRNKRYYFTFNSTNGAGADLSLKTKDTVCRGNILKECYNNNNTLLLSNRIFNAYKIINNYVGANTDNIFCNDELISNRIEEYCNSIEIYNISEGNTVGRNSTNITITNGSDNIIGHNCNEISVSYKCLSNKIGDNSKYITINQYSSYNIFGEASHDITLSDYCEFNKIEGNTFATKLGFACKNNLITNSHNINLKSYVLNSKIYSSIYIAINDFNDEITIGSQCYQITTGQYFSGINFGENCKNIFFTDLTDTPMSYARHILFHPGCVYLKIYNDNPTHDENGNVRYIQNLVFHSGEYGNSENPYALVPDRSNAFSTDYYKSDSKEVFL